MQLIVFPKLSLDNTIIIVPFSCQVLIIHKLCINYATLMTHRLYILFKNVLISLKQISPKSKFIQYQVVRGVKKL